MAGKAFDRVSLSEQVEKELKEEIISGVLRPGERVNLQSYSKRWDVSPTPLRDAVKRLEVNGLIEVSPRRGVFVANLDAQALQEIFELRVALERMTMRLSTPLVPDEVAQNVLERYKEVERMEKEEERQRALRGVDDLIHDIGVQYCGNERLKAMMADLGDFIRWSRQTIIRHLREPLENTLPEHIAICEAVVARDAEGAERAMETHLVNTLQRAHSFIDHGDMATPVPDNAPGNKS